MPAPRLLLHVDAQFASPYAMSAFVELSEKGLVFDVETVDLGTGENHRLERTTEVVFYGSRGAKLSVQAQAAVERLHAAADLLLPHDSEYLCGEWSIADVDLALMLNRLLLHGDPVPERLAAYARRQWMRPTVQLWVNRARPPL